MDPDETDDPSVVDNENEVTLVGRLSGDPERRELPSGDELWTFRLVVRRPVGPAARRAPVDTIDCAVWSGRARRSVAGWGAGDVVRVEGALRRRFYRAGAASVSRVDVEVARARLVRRSAVAAAGRPG